MGIKTKNGGTGTKVREQKKTNKGDKKFDVEAPKNEYRVEVEEILELDLDVETKQKQDKFFRPSVVEQILDLVEQGNVLEDASRILYLEPSIARRWYDENHKNFKFAVEQAESFSKHTQIHSIVKGRIGWTAAGWWLERRYPFEYLKKEKDDTPDEPGKEQVMKIGNQIIKF